MSKSIVLTLTLCAGLVAAAAAPASAQTAHPQCGDTITQDTTLYADLVDCPGDGLVIGANGVTLDLGGHVVDGAGANGSAGIRGSGFHRARIENGTVRQFGVGIALATWTHRGTGASGNVLRRLEIVDNDQDGVGLSRGSTNVLEHSRLAGNRSAGVTLDNTTGGNRIVENVIAGNGTGIRYWYGSSHPARGEVFAGNRVVDNEGNGIAAGAGIAPFFIHKTLIVGNDVRRNGADGILIDGRGSGNVVEGNRARFNGDDGIDAACGADVCIPGVFVTLSANAARHNGDLGIEADPYAGDGGGNRARHNGDPAECTGVACR